MVPGPSPRKSSGWNSSSQCQPFPMSRIEALHSIAILEQPLVSPELAFGSGTQLVVGTCWNFPLSVFWWPQPNFWGWAGMGDPHRLVEKSVHFSLVFKGFKTWDGRLSKTMVVRDSANSWWLQVYTLPGTHMEVKHHGKPPVCSGCHGLPFGPSSPHVTMWSSRECIMHGVVFQAKTVGPTSWWVWGPSVGKYLGLHLKSLTSPDLHVCSFHPKGYGGIGLSVVFCA